MVWMMTFAMMVIRMRATAYPVALILMTIIAKVIIQTIGGVVGV